MEYTEFLKSKTHLENNFGFKPIWDSNYLFDFQNYIVDNVLQRGRTAIFADTGLGKTAIQLVIAENIVRKTNKKVLILTPLAVAYQFMDEAEKIGINDVIHSLKGETNGKIIIANYQRLHYFNPNDFIGVVLDESSILKNESGAIRTEVTAFLRKIHYRFLATATPSPNDYVELGTSSEALGFLGYNEMLSRFFGNNENNISPLDIGTKWYLKPHAEKNFFKWVSGWSLSLRKPSDLGFSDDNYILPKLHTNFVEIKNEVNQSINNQLLLFNNIAKRLTDVRVEQKDTIEQRCIKAVELSENYDYSVYWCNFNDEGNLLAKLDNDSVQISGSMDLEKKEDILINFSKGNIKRLITKPKITAFGLNWQHCNHTTIFPTFSYEQLYQALRRFWRFGQKREVFADLIYSDGQKRVIDALLEKSDKANKLFDSLNANLHQNFEIENKQYNKELILPNF
jgi:hypothetical protein